MAANPVQKMAGQVGRLVVALQACGFPAYRISTSAASYEAWRLWLSPGAAPLCCEDRGSREEHPEPDTKTRLFSWGFRLLADPPAGPD